MNVAAAPGGSVARQEGDILEKLQAGPSWPQILASINQATRQASRLEIIQSMKI
jgi:hypothetical protein